MKYPHTVTNSPYSFFEFQEDEEKLKAILDSKGVVYGAGNRLSVLYAAWAKKSEDIKSKGVTQVSSVETHNLLDLCEMNIIISALADIPDGILQQKWAKLCKGTLNRYEETPLNSIARNTQFELLLYADLRRSGINCALCEPNPDILVEQDSVAVNIRCKRIFNYSTNAVSRNVHNAANQLRVDHKSNGHLGIIALATERVFSGGTTFLKSENQYKAIEHVRQLHDSFYDDHKRFWNSKKLLVLKIFQ
jgi:hypothetical protein